MMKPVLAYDGCVGSSNTYRYSVVDVDGGWLPPTLEVWVDAG
jgi:hypothetical protein